MKNELREIGSVIQYFAGDSAKAKRTHILNGKQFGAKTDKNHEHFLGLFIWVVIFGIIPAIIKFFNYLADHGIFWFVI